MRLVASDIDGTILGHDVRISDRTVRAFHACRSAGVELVFVTGRPPRWLHPLEEQLGHTGTVICSNGAVVWDLEEVETWLEQRRQTYLEGRAKIAPAPDVHQRKTRPVRPKDGLAS